MSAQLTLVQDLRAVGLDVTTLWDLVNSKRSYDAAIPVLLDWLSDLNNRVPTAERSQLREGIVRALTVPAARPRAASALIKEFRDADDQGDLGIRWVIGNALSVVGDDSVIDDLVVLAASPEFGRARQMIVEGLGRSRDPRVVPLLVGLLDDPDVAAHAVSALGRLRAVSARPQLERLLQDPRPLVKREAQKALKKLPAQ